MTRDVFVDGGMNLAFADAQRVQYPFGLPIPSCSAEQRRRAGGSRRGLSERRRREFRSRPAWRVAQGSRRSRPRNVGSPFGFAETSFSLVTLLLAKQKKVTRASGAENLANSNQEKNTNRRHSVECPRCDSGRAANPRIAICVMQCCTTSRQLVHWPFYEPLR